MSLLFCLEATGLAKVNTSARVEHRQMQSKWLALAIASGMFAALNGVFAKLYVEI